MHDPTPAWAMTAAMGTATTTVFAVFAVYEATLLAFDAGGAAAAIGLVGSVVGGLAIRYWRDYLASMKDTDHAEMLRLADEVKRLKADLVDAKEDRDRLRRAAVEDREAFARLQQIKLMEVGFAKTTQMPSPDAAPDVHAPEPSP